MATKKTKVEVKATTIDFSNSLEKIKETAKTVNNEVIDTAYEIIEDLRTNGTQLRASATVRVNEAIENATMTNGVKFVKETAKSINAYNLETAEEIIEAAMEGGKAWQNILTKSLKGGVSLLEKQQDITLTALEGLKKQYQTGNFRLKELFKFDFNFRGAEETMETATKKATAKAKASAKLVVDTAKKAAKPAKKAASTKAKVATTAKKAAKAATTTAKKVTKTKTATAAKTAVTRNKLTVIEGVGPKIEELLQKGGIYTFQQLAEASQETLKGILAAGGSRYKMHNPATWNQQAALAAAGKREELTKLQEELKGGRVAK